MAEIKLKEIRKSFSVNGEKIEVLSGLNLSIPEGKITVLLGKSGCGKTTILRLIANLEGSDSGEIDRGAGSRTAFVFQEPRLMPWLNVFDNVKFGLKKEELIPEEIDRQIEIVGLSKFKKAFPAQLSGGMQQRVALARALAYKPDFIMMDEPFAALDYFTREQMQKELVKIQSKGKNSILFVTHSIDEAILLGDKIAIIEGGKVKHEFEIQEDKNSRNLLKENFLNLRMQIMMQLENR